jgi:hypothetical protein
MANREEFLKIGENIGGFKIDPNRSLPNMPEGVSAEMLWDLWDIGVKFGKEENSRLIEFKSAYLVLDLYDFRRNGAGWVAGLSIRKPIVCTIENDAVFMFQLANDLIVTLNKRISAEIISQAIKDIDAIAKLRCRIKNSVRI